MLKIGNFVAVFLMMSGVAFGQASQAVVEESPWSGAFSLGYLSTSGNTDTTSYSTKFNVGFLSGDWAHAFNAAANGADDTGAATAEAFQAGWKSEYNFTAHDFIFGTIDWRKDRFSGVDKQLTEAVSYGRRLLDTPKHLLSAGLGVGYRQADLSDGTSESGVIGRGSIDYSWKFSETAGFDEHIVVESGSDNTYFESVSAVRAKLINDFALVLSYTIKQNSDVPVGNEKTDRLSAISIEYAF
jgi:putative salt-induced outer membrane protein